MADSDFSEVNPILSKFYRRKRALLLLFWLQKSKEKICLNNAQFAVKNILKV
jgi:hypothetical protein